MAQQSNEHVEQRSIRRTVLTRLPAPWTLLLATPWPGREDGVLDLAIGPSGLFVIVDGDEPARAVAAATDVATLLPGLARENVLGVLTGAEPELPWDEVDGAIVCGSLELPRLLRALPRTLTSEQVAGIVSVLHVALERAEHDRRTAVEAQETRDAEIPPPVTMPVTGSRTQSLITDARGAAEVRRRLRLHRPPGAHRSAGGTT